MIILRPQHTHTHTHTHTLTPPPQVQLHSQVLKDETIYHIGSALKYSRKKKRRGKDKVLITGNRYREVHYISLTPGHV